MKILKVILAGLIAVVVLSAFVLFFSYDGIHFTNRSGATDYNWRSGENISTMTEGFAFIHMDEDGFNNDSVVSNPDILFMGSSHTDDLHFSRKYNAAVLVEKLTGKTVYNIGMSGHDIYRCVSNFCDAVDTYNPGSYVVIETATVQLAVKNMKKVIEGTDQAIVSYDDGLMYYAQLIPVFKPLYKQFSSWIEGTESSSTKTGGSFNVSEYEETLGLFLSIVAEKSAKKGITAIVYYHPSEKLNADGSVTYKTDANYLASFEKICGELGIVFVDMTESFAKEYEENHNLAHGFINTAVGKGHLNRNGHRVIAERLAEEIK